MTTENATISSRRLRIGLLFIFGWWLQLPVLIMLAAPALGYSDSDRAVIALAAIVMIVQTVFAFIGVLLAGKEIIKIIRDTKNRDVPKTIWGIFRHGSVESTKTQ